MISIRKLGFTEFNEGESCLRLNIFYVSPYKKPFCDLCLELNLEKHIGMYFHRNALMFHVHCLSNEHICMQSSMYPRRLYVHHQIGLVQLLSIVPRSF